MSKDLYQKGTIVYRLFDPIEGKFCCSGRSLYAGNGRSVWFSAAAAAVTRRNLPEDVQARVVLKTYDLVEHLTS